MLKINKNLSLIVILILIFSTTKLFAERIQKIIIEGNARVSEETVKTYGEVQINDELDEKKLDDILRNLNSTDFFEDINVQFKNNILRISLKEYPVVNQLILTGEPSNKIKDQIKKIIRLKAKQSFIKSYLSSDVEMIKKLYSSIGYNFSDVKAKINRIDDRNLDLLIEINRGNKTKIASIKFIGDKKVKEKRLRDVIASEENKFYKIISRNTVFSENLINLDLRLLTNYYKSLGYYDVKITSNSAELTLSV